MLNSITVGTGSINVVWLHGLLGQGRNFNSVAKSLGDVATSRLVDLPNHGRSPWTDRFDYRDMADAVADLIRAQYTAPVVVIGHSMGGKTAMQLALRHPELVSRLVIVDISMAARDLGASIENLLAAANRLDVRNLVSRKQAETEITAAGADRASRDLLLQNLHRDADHWAWRANIPLLAASVPAIAGWPPTAETFDRPTLWLTGSQSHRVADEDRPALVAAFPRLRRTNIRGADHWVHADNPEAFVSAVRGFLN